MKTSSGVKQAMDWKERNKWQAVGQAVINAATAVRGEPARVVMEMEDRQVHVLISLPPRDGTMDPEDARIIEIEDWVGLGRNRVMKTNDAWERGSGEDDEGQE